MSQQDREFTWGSMAVLGAVLIGSTFNGASLAGVALSVFLIDIADDYGWSRASLGGASTLIYIGVAISAPVLGKVVDRYGARAVLLPMTIASGILLTSFSITGVSLVAFYLAYLLLGLTQPGTITHSKLISSWFSFRRGLALTVIGIGIFFAQILIPPFAHWLKTEAGWHYAYVALGAVELLISFPILYAFFRERPPELRPTDDAVRDPRRSDGAPHIRVHQAMAGRTYWLLIGSQAGVTMAFLSVSTHGIAILGEHGLSPAMAAWGLSTFALGGLSAQILTGYLLDRFDTPRVIAPFALITVLSLILLQTSQNVTLSLVAIFLFGAGCSACGPISYFTTRYFGVRNFSSIYGSFIPFLVLLAGGAPIATGAVFDATNSYFWALITADFALAISAIFLLLLPPYSYSVRIGGEPAPVAGQYENTARVV